MQQAACKPVSWLDERREELLVGEVVAMLCPSNKERFTCMHAPLPLLRESR